VGLGYGFNGLLDGNKSLLAEYARAGAPFLIVEGDQPIAGVDLNNSGMSLAFPEKTPGNPWEEATGTRHVLSILIAECLLKHRFLSAGTNEHDECFQGDTKDANHPVCSVEKKGAEEDEPCCIEGMPHPAIRAIRDQGVTIPNAQGGAEIPSEYAMDTEDGNDADCRSENPEQANGNRDMQGSPVHPSRHEDVDEQRSHGQDEEKGTD
jgi:hypothetical protein